MLESRLTRWPLVRGKVRDMYDLGGRLLMVTTDRISAFDWVLTPGIPDKGRVLTQLSLHWFSTLGVTHHVLTADLDSVLGLSGEDRVQLQGRSLLVRKLDVIPYECVVRGYLSGSAWKDYCRNGQVCGLRLPAGMRESQQLAEPLFTPATKAATGHDENVPFAAMVDAVGPKLAERLKSESLEVYARGAALARDRGILIADTKFEWGLDGGDLFLADEVLTPDSSRFWPADSYQPGGPQPSFDKQFVRDWLETTGWDKNSTPPPLPEDIVARTRDRYVEAYERLTGKSFPWR